MCDSARVQVALGLVGRTLSCVSFQTPPRPLTGHWLADNICLVSFAFCKMRYLVSSGDEGKGQQCENDFKE